MPTPCTPSPPPGVALIACCALIGLGAGCEDVEPDASSCRPWTELLRPAPTSTPSPTARKVLAPAPGQVYAGFYSIGDVQAGLGSFTDKSAGRTPPIVFTFHDWTGDAQTGGFEVGDLTLRTLDTPLEDESLTPAELATQLAEDNAVLALAWDCLGYYALEPGYFLGQDTRVVRQEDILAGTYDSYLRHVAEQVKALGVPIMLSPFGEFGLASAFSYGEAGYEAAETTASVCDAYGDPAWPDGPERAHDILRHVIDVFRDAEVENVTWFLYASTNYMNPAASDYTWDHPGYVYPGDDYIDWIGHSLYFSDDEALHNQDLGTFSYAFDAGFEAWREVTDKPFYAPEFGIAGDGQSSLAPQITDVLARLPETGVSAFTYADAPLFEVLFSLPRLGSNEGEIDAWQSGVAEDAYPEAPTLSE